MPHQKSQPSWILGRASCSHPLNERRKVFVMMQAYMDDSGTHADSHNCVIAGYVGGIAEWRRFEIRWQRVLTKYAVSQFHARRFWARGKNSEPVGEYKGWNHQKRGEFLDQLLAVIESTKVYPFASGVIGAEWGKLSMSQRRFFTGATRQYPTGAPSRPMFLGFVTSIVRVTRYCKPGILVNIVFHDDRPNEHRPFKQGWALICYSELKRLNPELAKRLGDLAFSPSLTALPLQAADLIAYEAHNWAKEANGDPSYRVNPVYMRALKNFRSREDFQMYDRQRLENFLKMTPSSLSRRNPA